MITKGSEIIELNLEDESITSTVNAGANEIVSFTPPLGEVWNILWLYMEAPTPGGTSSGTHTFDVMQYPTGFNSSILLKMVGTHNTTISVKEGVFTADSVLKPTTEVGQYKAIETLWATKDHPISVRYKNDTDVNQSNTIYIVARVLKYKASVA